jgi:hypothetical protein
MARPTSQPVRALDDDTLRSIYAATAGFCHRCRRKLAYMRFACDDGRGAWDIDAVCPAPRATALLPICRACSQRAPLRPAQPRPAAPAEPVPADIPSPAPEGTSVSTGALVGGAFGALLGGLWGALLGGLVGATLELHG